MHPPPHSFFAWDSDYGYFIMIIHFQSKYLWSNLSAEVQINIK